MLPSNVSMSDADDVHDSNHSESAAEDHKQQNQENSVEVQTEGYTGTVRTEEHRQQNQNQENSVEVQTEGDTSTVRTEIRAMYRRLLDSKNRLIAADETNEIKNILTEAKNLISKVKGAQGAAEDDEMFCLLCSSVEEVSQDFKFHMDEFAHNLSRKFNFSTENSANIVVTKLQVVSLGKAVSKYFSRTPTFKIVLGALDNEEGEMSTEISDLPHELLRYIFLMLPLEDRKMAVLVSQRWRNVGEDPVLWKWSVVTIRDGFDINKLSVRRIRKIKIIRVKPSLNGQPQQLEEFLKASLELPKLKEIRGLWYMNMRAVNSELLGRALGKLEKIFLQDEDNSFATGDQMVVIFKEMAEHGLIKILTLKWIDLCTLELDAGVLDKIMSGLQVLTLASVSLTNHQIQKVFESISENNQLKCVSFMYMDLLSVEPKIFGATLAKIESIYLGRPALSPIHVRALFVEMGRNSKIKTMNIIGSYLSSVHPKLFARVLWKLEEVSLSESDLTNEQLQELFTVLMQNCKINLLDLSGNDLSLIDPEELATVVTSIKHVVLEDASLTTYQITTVLLRTRENSSLKNLNICGNRMSEVKPDIVSRAMEIFELDIDSDGESEYEDDEEDSLDGFLASERDGDEESDAGD